MRALKMMNIHESCSICNGFLDEDDDIEKVRDGYAHSSCAKDRMDREYEELEKKHRCNDEDGVVCEHAVYIRKYKDSGRWVCAVTGEGLGHIKYDEPPDHCPFRAIKHGDTEGFLLLFRKKLGHRNKKVMACIRMFGRKSDE